LERLARDKPSSLLRVFVKRVLWPFLQEKTKPRRPATSSKKDDLLYEYYSEYLDEDEDDDYNDLDTSSDVVKVSNVATLFFFVTDAAIK
jgi:hypothetical protein